MTQKRIIITLHADNPSFADWIMMDEKGDITETKERVNLSDLSVDADTDVIVIAPAQDVLLTQATLPKLSKQKMLQALPYALEEQLISDVSDLHFAIGEYQPNGTLPVAVVARQKMDLWLNTLKSAGIEPVAFIPMTLTLPYYENKWEVYSYDDINMVRTGKYSGFAADKISFDKIVELKQSEHPDIIVTPVSSVTPTFTAMTETINLLQGPYSARRKITRMKNVWKYATYLALAWIILAFFSHLFSFFILHHHANTIESEINTIYYQHFPHATSVVAPRDRMEQKLKETINATQKNNFLSLLATVGKSLSTTHGVRLQHLDYRTGSLTLEVSSSTFDNLDELIRDLNAKGLNVKQQNSATVGSQVKATLIINAGAA